ncbi:MAG: hypothetical protein KJ555_09055 [Proteobacteria bacterium]|nr:hypothetical protein [Pseudomonadota bacterium]MBU4118895.1 hypothetical protein [Pseudomonadota bacterium]
MNFFKKIGGIGCCVVKKRAVSCEGSFAEGGRKYSQQPVQLLLDKARGLVYLHKIFQHLSVGVVEKRRPGRKSANRETTQA